MLGFIIQFKQKLCIVPIHNESLFIPYEIILSRIVSAATLVYVNATIFFLPISNNSLFSRIKQSLETNVFVFPEPGQAVSNRLPSNFTASSCSDVKFLYGIITTPKI